MIELNQEELGHTKFEKARIIGSRALQLAMGAPCLMKLTSKQLEELKFNPIEIAKLEWDAGVIPINVKRVKPPKMGEHDKEAKDSNSRHAAKAVEQADEGGMSESGGTPDEE